jgi:hypothetical protein
MCIIIWALTLFALMLLLSLWGKGKEEACQYVFKGMGEWKWAHGHVLNAGLVLDLGTCHVERHHDGVPEALSTGQHPRIPRPPAL